MPPIAKQYVDVPMTNYSLELKNYNYLADTLAPVIPVKFDTGIYYEYGQEDFDVSGSDVRAPGASAGVIDYSLSTHTYGPLQDHSLKRKIPIEEQKNVMDPLDPFRDATRKLTARAKLYKEVDLVTKLSDTAKITQYSTPTNLWSDYANSTFMKDMNVAFDTLAASIQKPRQELTVTMGYPVWTVLINHPEIIERFKYSQQAVITPDMVKNLLQVKAVNIGYAVKKTSADGAADAKAYVWGKNLWVQYVEETPALQTVSGLYTLNMPQIFGPWVIKRWYDTDKESDYLRISYYYQQFVMAPQAIYFFSGVVA